jgi:hypothetical protein
MREYFISASTSPSTRPMLALIKPSSSVIADAANQVGQVPEDLRELEVPHDSVAGQFAALI